MAKMKANDAKIKAEEALLAEILSGMPANPIPWVPIVRIIAPLVARLAVRYALKRAKRNMSEAKVNAVSTQISGLVRAILGISPPLTGLNEK